jgi:hypothetical protein
MYQKPRKPVPITLARLPLELQIQILSHLQWDEVLRARQVSLYEIRTVILAQIPSLSDM